MNVTSIALSGVQAASTRLDAAANNIANSQTPGFRRDQVMQQTQESEGVLTVVGVALSTVGLGEWSGVVVAARGAITTATNSLARANLSNPFGGGDDA